MEKLSAGPSWNLRGARGPLAIALGATLSTGAAFAWALRQRDNRLRREIDLTGRVVLVTSRPGDLGGLIARRAAEEGARVALLCDSTREYPGEGDGRESAPYLRLSCDPGVRSEVQAAIREIESRIGPIEIVINATSSLWATIHATLESLRGMAERGRGRVVNIVSHVPGYGFSKGLHAQLNGLGVRVTTVVSAPGDPEKSAERVLDACRFGDKTLALGRAPFLFRLGYTAFPRLIPFISSGFRLSARQTL